MVVRKVSAAEFLGARSVIASADSPFGRQIKMHHEREAAAKSETARAREFAIGAHGDQRHGDRPYAEHLDEVVAVLIDAGYKGHYLTAGWLHDVVEDTCTPLADIEQHFGTAVAELVDAVSGSGDRPDHIALIYKKIRAHPAAAAVKLADRIANIEACEPGDKHALRYCNEHDGFAAIIKALVPCGLWKRYEKALQSARML